MLTQLCLLGFVEPHLFARHAAESTSAKHGYDTKHAAHLVRLMRTGIEVLETGDLRVRRPDAPELMKIRDGQYSYEELVAKTERLETAMKTAADGSTLPADVDHGALSELLRAAARLLMERAGVR